MTSYIVLKRTATRTWYREFDTLTEAQENWDFWSKVPKEWVELRLVEANIMYSVIGLQKETI